MQCAAAKRLNSSLIKDQIGPSWVKDGVFSFIHIFLNISSVVKHVLVSPVTQIWPILRNFGSSSHSATDGLIKPNTLIILPMITRCWHMITHSLWHFFESRSITWLKLRVEWRANWAALFSFWAQEELFSPARLQLHAAAFPSSQGWAAEAFWIMLMILVWCFC